MSILCIKKGFSEYFNIEFEHRCKKVIFYFWGRGWFFLELSYCKQTNKCRPITMVVDTSISTQQQQLANFRQTAGCSSGSVSSWQMLFYLFWWGASICKRVLTWPTDILKYPSTTSFYEDVKHSLSLLWRSKCTQHIFFFFLESMIFTTKGPIFPLFRESELVCVLLMLCCQFIF